MDEKDNVIEVNEEDLDIETLAEMAIEDESIADGDPDLLGFNGAEGLDEEEEKEA